jgi:hypothetical protein
MKPNTAQLLNLAGPSVVHVGLNRDALSICESIAARHNDTKYANAEKYTLQLHIASSLVTYGEQAGHSDYSCYSVF